MLFIWLFTFVVGSAGTVPWLYRGEPFGITTAFWCFVAFVGFVGIISKATEPKSPSDIFNQN